MLTQTSSVPGQGRFLGSVLRALKHVILAELQDSPMELTLLLFSLLFGFPGSFSSKESPSNAGDARDMGLIHGLGRSPGVGNGNLLQDSCLENPMDRGAWWATVHGVAKSRTQLSN